MPDYAARLQRVQQQMRAQNIDLLFLSRSANLSYVTGLLREQPNYGNTMYPGEWLTGAWVPANGAPILTLPRMVADFHAVQSGDMEVRVLGAGDNGLPTAAAVLESLHIAPTAHIAVEDRAWAESLINLQMLRPQATFSQASALLGPLRRIKDAGEIQIMREAGAVTEAAYAATLPQLKHGMTNLDLITEVNYQLRRNGATCDSFVTSFYNMGRNYPFDFHNRDEVLLIPLEAPVSISFDFGAVYKDYCYDFGRSLFFGEPDDEYRRIYALVMESQAAGIAALHVGNTCEAADAAARAVIAEAGYGETFRHRLGHGIGMDVHEPPFLTAGDTTVLEEGMCFTAEPSIFMPHVMGARVEDVVVVRPGAGEPLTSGFQQLYIVN
jgi:Xaa-Pro aminopeptidase